jgi:hypothetical protein
MLNLDELATRPPDVTHRYTQPDTRLFRHIRVIPVENFKIFLILTQNEDMRLPQKISLILNRLEWYVALFLMFAPIVQ